MRSKIYFIAFIISLISMQLNAQVAMGKWRTHFAYNNVDQIAQSENKIFAVSEGALFSIDKEYQGTEFYSKLSGMNDANITRIEYDSFNKQLLIVYLNGNIDVMNSGGVINIPDLYNKQMSTSKAVNHIYFSNNKAYLSCNFGILVINTQKHEIADTYFIGYNSTEVKVTNTTIHNNYIYAASGTTVYKALATEPNLVNFEFWSTLSNLPGSGIIQQIVSYAGKLFLQRDNKLYYQESNLSWTPIMTGINIASINLSNGKFIVNDGASSIYLLDELLTVKPISNIGNIFDVEYDSSNKVFWFAGNMLGVISFKENEGTTPPTINYFKPNGPAVNIPYSMTFANNKLFVVSGKPKNTEFMDATLMMYKDGIWSNILAQTIQDSTKNRVLNFMNVAVDPLDENHFFVTSFGTGLYEFKDNKFFKLYNNTNSTIQSHYLVPNVPLMYTQTVGAIYDPSGNLFLANCAVDAKIKVMLKTGVWKELKYPLLTNEILNNILINNQNPNQKWVTTFNVGQINIFDDKGTIDNQSDDEATAFTSFPDPDTEGSTISHTREYCIAQDKNGVIWLGTDVGPLLFYNTSKVFDTDYTCTRVKIPRNDGTEQADYLLQNEKIKAIVIDGANRKWIGTESSGVYLLSENGQETIKHFTILNSPLMSNDILSIAINPITGEVFFGTGQGIVSYQSDASLAGSAFGDVHAYPNPVREGYIGVITITGLVDNTHVKITDLNGNLVNQTISNGSLATWDAKDVHGRKVNTGIYLAICVNEDGSQSTITKIMVIN